MKSALQPCPKAIVSCTDKRGRDNALAVGYCCNCSYDPPMVMVGIVPSRFSYEMIKEAGCFVVNLPNQSGKELFDYTGSVSGRDADKFKEFGIQSVRANKINAPILTDCPINIECVIVDSIRTGSHEMFVGQIECVHADDSLTDPEGKINFSKAELL
ncbi:MAG: flavin reductase family protein [Clostridiales bacterium]|nr:flavin reductase family protein [Clostridiales bacterium]